MQAHQSTCSHIARSSILKYTFIKARTSMAASLDFKYFIKLAVAIADSDGIGGPIYLLSLRF